MILPVLGAGLVHVAVLKTGALRALAVPIDGGRRWRGVPALGENKTWRGVLLMTAATAVLVRLQAAVGHKNAPVLGLPHEYRRDLWIAGSMMGCAYCLAELPNSYIKRRLGIAPGARAPRAAAVQDVVDQMDSVIGCLLALRLFYRPRRGETELAFLLGTAIHLAVDRSLYAMGVKRHDR